MFTRSSARAGLAAILLAAPSAAQSPGSPRAGTLEIGAFGQWTWFDGNAGRLNAVPQDGLGYGGRLGVFFTPSLQLEADGYFSPQDRDPTEAFCCAGLQPTDIDASAFALRLNYNLPIGRLLGGPSQLLLGAGAVRTTYAFSGGTGADSSSSSFGVSGLAGLRLGIAGPLSVRLDGVADYMPSHEPSANLNLHARAGLSLLLGTARMLPVAVLPPPPPPMEIPAPIAEERIRVCVIQGNGLATIDAIYVPSRGDTLVTVNGERRAFAAAHPTTTPDYAGGEAWFVNNSSISFSGGDYVRVELARVMDPSQLVRVGDYRGVGVFAERGSDATQPVVFIPVRPGCEFQRYQRQAIIGAVRG
jgi:hypothetical protein